MGKARIFENGSRFELPNVPLSQENGRELNLLKKSKRSESVTPKKCTPTKAATLSERKAPLTSTAKASTPYGLRKRMNLNFNVAAPSKFELDHRDSSRRRKMNNDYMTDYHRNDENTDAGNFKQNGLNSENLDLSIQKRGNALNVNLALNVSSKASDESNESIEEVKVIEQDSNLTMNTPSAIKVAVRMRPLSASEKDTQGDTIKDVLIKDNKVLIPHKKECFEFDFCLDSSNHELFNYASQENVYRKMGEPLLKMAFQGYNVCLFAYGQSGSGKTYTMTGSDEVPGIIPRFLNDIFRKINSTSGIEFIVNISFSEIYNEKIYDLLSDDFNMYNKNLRVREHPQTGPYVEDLTTYTVDNYEHAMQLLESGSTRRATASTSANEQSSRSHSIFNIILVQNKKLDADDSNSETSCISKINLVDLAGSERANLSNNDRFREGSMINKSLLTLGKVISQLAENNGSVKPHSHIPYRDSVLTYLLKDSLGGNSRTSMIATISPAKSHLDETISTLRYASTAQKIINIVHVNEDPKMKVINSLLKQISFLRKEVDRSKEQSLNNSSESEKEVGNQDQNCGICENLAKDVSSLKEKFESTLKEQKKLLKEVEKFKNEVSKENSKLDESKLAKLKSTLLDDLKSMLRKTEEEDVLADIPDYAAKMDDVIRNEQLEETEETITSGRKDNKKKNNKDNSNKNKNDTKAWGYKESNITSNASESVENDLTCQPSEEKGKSEQEVKTDSNDSTQNKPEEEEDTKREAKETVEEEDGKGKPSTSKSAFEKGEPTDFTAKFNKKEKKKDKRNSREVKPCDLDESNNDAYQDANENLEENAGDKENDKKEDWKQGNTKKGKGKKNKGRK